jgi:transposase-like protein
VTYPSSQLVGPIVPRPREGHRRRFSDDDKQWILQEAAQPGASAAEVARRSAIATNTVERAIRPVALGRKNHLFAGSDGGAARWATICSLITTAKLNSVEPFAYLRDVLERLSTGHAMNRIDELLPWNWARSISLAA